MFAAVNLSLRSVRMALTVAAAGAVLTSVSTSASAAVVMDDHFNTDTSANWTQSGGGNPVFFSTTNSFVNLTGTPNRIQHNAGFNPSSGNSTIVATMYSTGIGGFQQDTAVIAGIASTSSSNFLAVQAFALSRAVSLTTSAGDFTITTLPAFNTNRAVITLQLFPATSEYQVLVAAPFQPGPPGFSIPAVDYDSGLRSLTADIPGFSLASLGNSSALLGSAAANATQNTRAVNVDRIVIDQVIPSPASAALLGLGSIVCQRRRRHA